MLKVRGEDYISRVVDNAFDMANKMETMIKRRDGFRMVLEQSCTNVCFVYIILGNGRIEYREFKTMLGF